MEIISKAGNLDASAAISGGIFAEESPLMNVADVSRVLKVPASVVRQYCRDGKLPSLKIGRRVYIPRDELEEQIRRDMRGTEARHE